MAPKTTPAPDAKLTPHSTDAEQSTLGALLIDQDALYKIADNITASDFYLPAHRKIYDAITALAEKSQPVDVMSVTNYLKEKEQLQLVGGSSYLAELTNYVTSAAHVNHYAQIVREKKVLRDLISASAAITEEAFAAGQDVDELMADVEKRIFAIAQRSVIQNFIPIKEELKGAFERIERLQEHRDALRGVATGFSRLDSLLSGLQKSNLVILGARPSLGKTSLALDIARHAAIKTKTPVGIFSLEMSREEVTDRLIAGTSNVSLWKLRTGRISHEDNQLLGAGIGILNEAPIFIDDTPSPNITQMRAMARRLQMQHGLGLIVVDYLQLIAPRKSSDNMVQQVTEISRGLKLIARELNVPVLALSQLSRAVDQRDNKRPQLHDLRESGSIEQDADVVLFIYRKDRERNGQEVAPEEQNIAEILVAKHRNGPLGTLTLGFDPDAVSFREFDDRHSTASAATGGTNNDFDF